MRILLDAASLTSRPELVSAFLAMIQADAQFLRASYPDFDDWLLGKVIPGLFTGERSAVVEHCDGVANGLLIVKHTADEKKLCTLRVRTDYENRGLGVRLFQTAFDLLQTDRPLLSVSETTLPKFSRLFDYFGFRTEAIYEGLYLPQVSEFAFNGLLGSDLEVHRPSQGPLAYSPGRPPLRLSKQSCRSIDALMP